MAAKIGHRAWGNIRKLPSGRWQASYVHNGQRHIAAATFSSQKLADRWLDDERDLIELDRRNLRVWTPPAERTPTALAAAELTLREYSERWIEHRNIAPRTRENYHYHLADNIYPA